MLLLQPSNPTKQVKAEQLCYTFGPPEGITVHPSDNIWQSFLWEEFTPILLLKPVSSKLPVADQSSDLPLYKFYSTADDLMSRQTGVFVLFQQYVVLKRLSTLTWIK